MFKKIVLPGDVDYEREYQALVSEAKAAGFINVHPEELLTAEEMAFAEEYSRKLDQQFADAAHLTMQDMFVVGGWNLSPYFKDLSAQIGCFLGVN